LDRQLFWAAIDRPIHHVSFREIDRFIDEQHHQGLAPTTVNRRLYALRHFFDFLIEQEVVDANPIQPSHVGQRGRPLPRALAKEPLAQVFAQIQQPMDRALFLLMLRGGLRVSEGAELKVRDLDWSQHARLIAQGKGRKDRRGYRSAAAVARLHACLQQRPSDVPGDLVFWNQKRPSRPLSVKAIQKTIQRYANAAGSTASGHSLRHTFASNLLEQGAERVSMREWLGHASISSSERYAKLSKQHGKQAYVRTMKKVLQRIKV
jgi:integrase/recombinase XerC